MDMVRVYQIAPEKLSLMECYVIRTAGGKIIVIDGGRDGHGKDFAPYLPAAIRAVLGLGQNDYFEVEAWFLSHAHTDHIYELGKMLEAFNSASNWRIRHLYFSFPPYENGFVHPSGPRDISSAELDALKRGLDNYTAVTGQPGMTYDAVNNAVITPEAIAAGLTFDIDGVLIDALLTWDDKGKCVNSASTVLRMRAGGKSILFLGDAYLDTGDRLLAAYGADALRSDYVQLAHHGQHGCSKEFYLAIGTDRAIRLWPSPVWVWGVYRHNAIVCDETRSWFGLPEKPDDYFAAGCDRTGRDIVSGLYGKYPDDPTKVSDWTQEILAQQLCAEL